MMLWTARPITWMAMCILATTPHDCVSQRASQWRLKQKIDILEDRHNVDIKQLDYDVTSLHERLDSLETYFNYSVVGDKKGQCENAVSANDGVERIEEVVQDAIGSMNFKFARMEVRTQEWIKGVKTNIKGAVAKFESVIGRLADLENRPQNIENLLSLQGNINETIREMSELFQEQLSNLTEKYVRMETLDAIDDRLRFTSEAVFGNARSDDWNLVFRATSGNGVNVVNAWLHGNGTHDDKPTDMFTKRRLPGGHYRDTRLDAWATLNIGYVRFSLYERGREVGYVVFNGHGSDNTNWFSKSRVLESSWFGITAGDSYNYFSIAGDKQLSRQIFINHAYGGCPVDRGHLVTMDAVDGARRVCYFDRHTSYPQFLFSRAPAAQYWDYGLFGRADFLAIYIKPHLV